MDVDEETIPSTSSGTRSGLTFEGLPPSQLPSIPRKDSPTSVVSITRALAVPTHTALPDITDAEIEADIAATYAQMEATRLTNVRLLLHISRNKRVTHAGTAPMDLTPETDKMEEEHKRNEDFLSSMEQTYNALHAARRPVPAQWAYPNQSTVDRYQEQDRSASNHAPQARSEAGFPVKPLSTWLRFGSSGSLSAYDWWANFEREIAPYVGEQIIGSHGDKYLLYLVHNDHFHANLKEKFKAPKEVLTVDYLERTFFETCLTIEERENAVTTLTKFGRLAGEPYSHYAHRIARATKLFRVQDNNDVVLTLLRQGLASSEMDTVNTRFQSQYLTGPAGARENFSAPVMPTTNSHAAKAESKQMWCDKCNKNGNHVSKDHISCDYCNKLGHKKDACRARTNDDAMNTRSVAHTAQTIDKTVPTADQAASGHIKLTFASAETTGIATTLVSAITTRDMSPVSDKEFIESVHSTDSVLAHAGRESRMSQDIPQEHMTINDEQSHMFETLVYNEMGDQNDNDKRLVVPIYFEGLQFEALIDSGATKSFIDKSLVEALKIEVSKARGNIFLGHKKMHVARTGVTEHIEVECNEHSLLASFELFDLQYPFVIGMDLFNKLGFSIGGIADGRANAQTLPTPTPDEKPSVLPLETPIEELTDKLKKLKAQFMSEIQDSIKDNAQIPLDSYCTLPEMHVFLDVPDGTTIYRRPRTFAEQQQHIFDEQVDKWLKDGVITLAPANNRHNNTLTLAAKKDLLGNKTKWRVCLDPRPLNKLLKDDNHPVPLISDILQQIGGHMIYTTLDLTQAYHRLPIEAGHQPLTAFMHRGTQYMFRRAPFGLKPLSSIFQRGMTRILGDLPFVLVFIDDIVIFSKTKEEHAAHVKCVIERLTEAKLISLLSTQKNHTSQHRLYSSALLSTWLENGEFVNQVMLAMTSEFNVDHRLLTPYHPRGNGVAERHVKVAVDILKKEHHQKQDTWDLHVPMAQLAMNTRIVALHNSSPFSLFFARKANGFRNYSKSTKNVMTHKQLCDRLAYMTEIVFPAIDKKSEETQKKMIARFNATVLHNEFPDGAKVMTLDPIRGNKLTPRYEGPYTVVRRTTGGSYELRDGTGESLSRNYAPSQLKLVLEDLNTLPIFEIEYILDHRPHPSRKGEWEYKAKWAGYSKDDYTWEPEENFIEKQCIREYWQLLKENKRPQDQRSKRYQTRTRN
ncbi:hypothetical protein EMPS_07455 [Entomortierella parvispora]|uniref:Reverse transcriptase n=1 Tax=Entomortierella parvispora TaxID=205924 RepID=A0A9P3LYG1_9FUNG|nr:hypothetical protein EMPS_07455 [Entomortierella parvispora]